MATELINIWGNFTSFDLTTNIGVRGFNQAFLKNQVYGMKQGNSNSNNTINSVDRLIIRLMSDRDNIYLSADINMDGRVNAVDRILSRSTKDTIEII